MKNNVVKNNKKGGGNMSSNSRDSVHCVPLTPEIVYQASGRTMTDRTHEVGML
jgi:hypothetical protein